ncbi:DUF1361 domain-containing protein [Leptothoe kymatousa]|uniref:DUF1361 domain-containing protein n=1 Tax=Leptothoe kymatousa TAU-MAC 1615 TaxID=2364775 RepID=A0ABS5Y5Q3_9CYAN|nr:DUF1361 domain-containing protein [Leptothoe kymatousa]MBT9313147.1 DUF1361 domain-containing protein [Leptothoe kymatousa TAU-MAC 1615]
MTTWLLHGLDTAHGNLPFMVWNSFLALIPLILSFWLFRGRGSHRRHWPWWIGFTLFVAFLPNAPYVLTDIIHLVKDIRMGTSVWAIALILIPQYFLFIGFGVATYTLSLVNLGRYLSREGKCRWVLPAELTLHGLTALGIYLGRFLRFNSWDLVTSPLAVMGNTLALLLSKWPLAVMFGTFIILAVVYWLLKQVTLASILYWRTRNLRTAQRYWA